MINAYLYLFVLAIPDFCWLDLLSPAKNIQKWEIISQVANTQDFSYIQYLTLFLMMSTGLDPNCMTKELTSTFELLTSHSFVATFHPTEFIHIYQLIWSVHPIWIYWTDDCCLWTNCLWKFSWWLVRNLHFKRFLVSIMNCYAVSISLVNQDLFSLS